MKFKDAIEEVRSRSDIVEIVSTFLPLKRAGRSLKGLCPFHAEKTPSFQVSPDKQLFHCFGCGVGGSVFDFVMKIRNFSFHEALEYLAARTNVIIDALDPKEAGQVESERKERDELLEINALAADFFQSNLRDLKIGAAARDYLKSRGLDEAWIDQLKIGLAPEGWDHLARHIMKKGVMLGTAEKLGLIAAREPHPSQAGNYYDRFRSRIIFPIYDEKKRLIAFGGRLLLPVGHVSDGKEGGKYINSPQSPLFDKSRSFYLIDRAHESIRSLREAIVVEGYLDAIALHRAGLTHAVATMGTAMTLSHGKVLSRYAERVHTLFDGDEAGERAAKRTLGPMAQSGLDAFVAQLPKEHDPDSYLQTFGPAALKAAIKVNQPLLEYCCRTALKDGRSTRETAGLLEEILTEVRKVPNRLQRELWLQQFSTVTGFNEATLRGLRSRSELTNGNHRVSSNAATQLEVGGTPNTIPEPATGCEEMLICLAFESHNVYEMLRSYEGPALIRQPNLAALLQNQLASGGKSAGDFARVLESLADQDLRRRLEARLFEVAELSDSAKLQAARDCMGKILKRNFEYRMRELSQKISSAEKAHNQELLHDLLHEKNSLLASNKPVRINP